MTCGFCGHSFDESEGKQGCGGCGGGCGGVHCPRCGYKNLREPGIISLLRKITGTKTTTTNQLKEKRS